MGNEVTMPQLSWRMIGICAPTSPARTLTPERDQISKTGIMDSKTKLRDDCERHGTDPATLSTTSLAPARGLR